MSAQGLSKRRLKKQLRYAAQGIAIGTIASLALLSATILLIRWTMGQRVRHSLLFGFLLFTTALTLMIWRFWRVKREPRGGRRSVSRVPVTEFSKEDDKTKTA